MSQAALERDAGASRGGQCAQPSASQSGATATTTSPTTATLQLLHDLRVLAGLPRAGLGQVALGELHVLVEHVGPFPPGEHIFREGDPFDAIAAVRAGTVKTYVIDVDGREQVLGFHLPGEVIGLNAHRRRALSVQRGRARHRDAVPVLVSAAWPMLATRLPRSAAAPVPLLSRDIGKATLLAGDFTRTQRMAAFLVSLARRLAARGFSATPVPAHDDAHRHRELPATRPGDREPRARAASRTTACVHVDRREIEIARLERLEALARPRCAEPDIRA